MSSTVVDTVTNMVQPIVDKHGFELVEVEFVKEGQSWFLRVYIDKENGINIEECAMVSDELSQLLDEAEPDPIPQAYFLEVSSPGAERPLKKDADFKNAIGEYIHISLYVAVEKKKVFEGYLKDFDGQQLTIEYMVKTRKKELTVDLSKIAFARLAIKI